MYVLSNKGWKDKRLDYYLDKNQCRISVCQWFLLDEINDQYIVVPRSGRLILDYIRKVGINQVFKKIKSRLNEELRNSKYISFGLGYVIESKSSHFKTSDPVCFIAYNHPKLVDCLAIDDRFVAPLTSKISNLKENNILFYSAIDSFPSPKLKPYYSWSPYSGIETSRGKVRDVLQDLEKFFIEDDKFRNNLVKEIFNKDVNRVIECSTNKYVTEERKSSELNGVIIGYGQYAKTIILSFISDKVKVTKVHEIDPLQFDVFQSNKFDFDTSPFPDFSQKCDVLFIASYHHMHAKEAVRGLENGAYVLIEKPIVTNKTEFEKLKEAIKKYPGKFFCGFHKRYQKFNQFVHQDLNVKLGDPISYFAIIYEIALPERHWYNWPNSQSRIVSNGCHWIDHFLFLNDYSKPTKVKLELSETKDYHIFIELENGASFSMILTCKGSPRLGVREYIELCAEDRRVKIIDSRQYTAETARKKIRKFKLNALSGHKKMYKIITEKMARGEEGDSLESLISTEVMLVLEEQYELMVNHEFVLEKKTENFN